MKKRIGCETMISCVALLTAIALLYSFFPDIAGAQGSYSTGFLSRYNIDPANTDAYIDTEKEKKGRMWGLRMLNRT